MVVCMVVDGGHLVGHAVQFVDEPSPFCFRKSHMEFLGQLHTHTHTHTHTYTHIYTI